MSVGAVVDDLDTEVSAESPPVADPSGGGLGDLIRGKIKKPRRTLLYGVQGVGKSTWANDAPSAVFVPTEEGLNDIDCDKFPVAKSFDEFYGRLIQLGTTDHGYLTVAIDSLDWLERLVWAKVCTDKGVVSIEDLGWGKGYKTACDYWSKLLIGLDYLRDKKGMNVILVAHASIQRYENPETEGYDRYTPQLHKWAAAMIQEWCDEVFFATYKVYTKSEGDGQKKTVKGIGGDERIIRCKEKPFAVAKNRLRMPDEIPMSYAAYAQYQEN